MFKFVSKAIGVCGYIIQYGCITHCTFEYIGDFVVCVGPSMEPTLTTNNVLITDRISPRLAKLQRGDIIITKSPTNPVQHVCKRIIGMPGDRIMTRASFNLNPLSNTYTIYTTVLPNASVEPEQHQLSPKSKQHYEALAKLREKVDYVSHSVEEPRGNLPPEQPQHSTADLHGKEEETSHQEPRTSIVIVPRGHLWIEGDNVQNSSDSRNYGPVPIGLVKSRAVCRLWPLSEFKLFV
ncbi:mitochondrial inner membrane protease subunit 1 [Anopheles ziemanni]|uniref:mitochondrial inner membrane protease subunit 1 n=1 Tax=Anopheles coustani TaxID=139045 RepID=UPI002659D534|nr:mitochondrial inner membrane protease subunit 1 [Anopheles coustani]XP_058172573.1 mitochondrial inner membrane protease subunit 1 [Anopheles ziemanni]